MKRVFKLSLLLLVVNLSVSYANSYNIVGKITGFKNGDKVYLSDGDSEDELDSTILDNNCFNLNGTLKYGPMYLTITIRDGKGKHELLVFVGLGKVSITGSKVDFPYNIIVSGETEQSKYNAYIRLLKPFNIKSDRTWQTYTKAKGDDKRKAGMAFNAIGTEINKITKNWIFANPNSYFATKMLYDYLADCGRDTIEKFYKALKSDVKHSIYGKRINNFLTKGDTLKISDRYFDFEAYDISGKKIKLSGFTGKYILLDFSSVACGPCRESIAELKSLSKKYKDKLTIITYTLDKRVDWLQQLKADNITWLSVIDPEGSYSKTLLKYNIRSIPTFYLLSPNGIVVDKWIGYQKLNSKPGDLEQHIINVN
jgi:thiol-disulfide isomerase/thioredoxin